MMAPASGGLMSVAPASIAASVTSSGSWPLSGTLMMPFCSNCQATGEKEPPDRVKALRISDAVLFRFVGHRRHDDRDVRLP